MTDTSSSNHHLPRRYAENGNAFPGWPGHGQTAQSIGKPLQPSQDSAGEPKSPVQVISQGSASSCLENRAERRVRKNARKAC